MREDEDDDRLSVSVAFGRGLNTAQPGNPVNHVVLPKKIKVNQDGVVHFLVAGFHQVAVYKPGTKPKDIVVPDTGTFINDREQPTFTWGSIRQEGQGIRRRPRRTPSSPGVTPGLTPKIV